MKGKPANFEFIVTLSTREITSPYLHKRIAGLIQDLLNYYIQKNYALKKNEWAPGIYPLDSGFNNKIAITFDNGPTNKTHSILNVLKRHNIHASFFISGNKLQNPGDQTDPNMTKIIQRLIHEGHSLGNQGLEQVHLSQKKMGPNPRSFHQEFYSVQTRLNKILKTPYVFKQIRPPYGDRGVLNASYHNQTFFQPGAVDQEAYQNIQSMILWQADAQDSIVGRGLLTENQALQQLLRSLNHKQGGIVRFQNQSVSSRLLEAFLQTIEYQNKFTFVSVDELLQEKYERR